MPAHLDLLSKARIIGKLEDNWSIRTVAQQFGINKSTVLKIKKRWEEERTVSRRRGSARPRISTREEDALLLQHLRENPFNTINNAKIAVNFPGSRSTANRRIQESDLKSCVAVKKLSLTEVNKQARLLFSLNHVYRELPFWQNVIFTDEKLFQSTYNGRIRVYRPPHARFQEQYTYSVKRSGRFNVNVWGWCSYKGLGVCYKVDGRFNADNYSHILENVMLPSVRQLYPENFIYQHDNCPVHTANVVRTWLHNNNIETLPWPANSPDLNPIENIWGLLTKKLYSQNINFLNVNHLWDSIENAWEELAADENYMQQLANSMPHRLNTVIAVNGRMTKY